MSRRETKDSDSRHNRSRFDREPSPKRSRRDGKPETERPRRDDKPESERSANNLSLKTRENSDGDQKHHRRLQDDLPLEAPSAPDPKAEAETLTKESDKKINGHREGTKHSSDPNEAPRSRSFSQQHDERGNAGQAGRSSSHKETSERGWWRDARDGQSDRGSSRWTSNDSRQRDEKSRVRADDSSRSWRHDSYSKMDSDSKPPPARKRPSFSEKKIPVDAAPVSEKEATEPTKPRHTDTTPLVGENDKEERRKTVADKPEKALAGERDGGNHRDLRRGNFSSRDRYYDGNGGRGGGFERGRERYGGRQGQNRPNGGEGADKWKHDLFEEANQSPTKMTEEDQIAKVEALLASS